jgi:UDP-glucuronate 4-epimerase
MDPILVTGAAGFIGAALCKRLLSDSHEVFGIDNLDIADKAQMEQLFAEYKIKSVIHLAAQASVRHSVTHPHICAESNLTGFLHVLEGCR